MPVCRNCNTSFPNFVEVDGRKRNLQRRKYCLECSPFGEHNTGKLHVTHKCRTCGDTNPNNFYGDRKVECKRCFNERTRLRQVDNRTYARELLGNKCVACGYDKYPCSLEVHHTDPSLKDINYASMAGWSKERIKKELEGCILLCSNCHQAYHSGYDIGI